MCKLSPGFDCLGLCSFLGSLVFIPILLSAVTSLIAFTSGACVYQLGLYSPPGSYSSLEAVLTVWLAFTFPLKLIYPTVFTLSIWGCFFFCKDKGCQLLGKLTA